MAGQGETQTPNAGGDREQLQWMQASGDWAQNLPYLMPIKVFEMK